MLTAHLRLCWAPQTEEQDDGAWCPPSRRLSPWAKAGTRAGPGDRTRQQSREPETTSRDSVRDTAQERRTPASRWARDGEGNVRGCSLRLRPGFRYPAGGNFIAN